MDLTIVVINFNTKELTRKCLDSILKNTKNLLYEIVVVDNASTDGSQTFLLRLYRKIRFISFIGNKKNLGFAKANNQGARKAKGKFILFLNSDTEIYDNVLGEMCEWMDQKQKVAVSTCALVNKNGTLQGSGGYFPTLPRVFSWMFFIEDIPYLDKLIKPFHPVHMKSFFYKGLSQFKKMRSQDWITGAFFLVKRDVFEEVGGFDEDYFMYTEEVDLCFRIKKLGFEVWYLPQWEIVHLGGASSTNEFPILSEFKSVELYYQKNMPRWQYQYLRIFLKCGTVIRALVFGMLSGREAYKLYAKANRAI